jgi:hypothetical protein
MSTRVVGKLDNWGDADLGGSEFMQIDEGNNPVRLISSPYQFYIHWTKDATGANRKVRCALEDCPICQQGERAQARWFISVINRKSNKPMILEIGQQIYKQVLGLAKKDKWGDPRRYDIDIERQPKGSQPLYIVSPEPKEDLSPEEKAMVKEFLARVDLTKMAAAPTADEVKEKVGMKEASTPNSSVSNDFADPAPAKKGTTSEDDFNFDN